MPLTPEQIAMIRRKEAMMPEALKRNPLNDYTEGWFHVTLNTRGEAPVLGYVAGDPDADDGSPNAPRCVLTELGKRVEECWESIPSYYPEVEVVAFQAMPEHVHGLLHLKPANRAHLGQVVRGFMIGCTHGYWDLLGIAWHDIGQARGGIPQIMTDRDHSCSYRGPALMVRGYNDVEAIGEEEIATKCQYIRNNPRHRLIARSKPDRFRVVRNRQSMQWTLERALAAVAADPWIGGSSERCRTLQALVAQRLKRHPDNGAALVLDYVGNRALLAAERKVSLICHRADVGLFERQRAAVMLAARSGAVVVGAFISPREREIMKLLMQEQLPFIELMDNGFGPRYKPGGRAFYSTAENRHVQLTCWTYEYVDGNRSRPNLTRERCLVMNELARLVSGVGDDWWKTI